jgi:hypothetical protein
MIDLPLVESNPLYWSVDQTIDPNSPGPLQDRVNANVLMADDLLPGRAE